MKPILLFLSLSLSALAQPTAALLPWQPTQFFTNTGAVAAGYKVCTYIAGTSTGLATYTDATATVANNVPPNAIVLDSTGRANIWLLDRAYKINLYTAGSDSTCNTGTLVLSVDNINPLPRYSATAIPSSGTWQTGDFVFNSAPNTTPGSSSAVIGWICTSGGTPGTWVALMPALGGHIPSALTVDQTLTVTGTSTFNGSATFNAAAAFNGVSTFTAQLSDQANVFNVASDFTTAANTSLQTITGLSWTLAANTAQNVPFHCELAYSQATGVVAVAFGIQSATIAPTNIFATGLESTNTTAATEGTLPTLTTTTATNIVSATPSAVTTVWRVSLAGFIENPSNASTNQINIMVSTATAADAVTVKRGSWCRIF